MDIFTCSDLHLEHYYEIDALEILKSFPKTETIILAGDICNIEDKMKIYMDYLSNQYKHIILIPGNHEFWQRSFTNTWNSFKELSRDHSNIHILNNSSIIIDNIAFHGSVGFPIIPRSYNFKFMDLSYMIFPDNWFNQESNKSWEFFKDTVTQLNKNNPYKANIFISHYTPTIKGIAPIYMANPYNWYFCLDKDELLESIEFPCYWISGHTHTPFTTTINNCKVVCNPKGYPSERYSSLFSLDTILTIE